MTSEGGAGCRLPIVSDLVTLHRSLDLKSFEVFDNDIVKGLLDGIRNFGLLSRLIDFSAETSALPFSNC